MESRHFPKQERELEKDRQKPYLIGFGGKFQIGTRYGKSQFETDAELRAFPLPTGHLSSHASESSGVVYLPQVLPPDADGNCSSSSEKDRKRQHPGLPRDHQVAARAWNDRGRKNLPSHTLARRHLPCACAPLSEGQRE